MSSGAAAFSWWSRLDRLLKSNLSEIPMNRCYSRLLLLRAGLETCCNWFHLDKCITNKNGYYHCDNCPHQSTDTSSSKNAISTSQPYKNQSFHKALKTQFSRTTHCIEKTARTDEALSGQGVLRIPGKYAIAEGCCRKIQNGPSMVLRFGALNVGSLTGRSMEIAEMLERRRIDICCLQETRWKLNGVCHVNSDKEKYKLFWNGQKTAKNGVGIFVREPLAQAATLEKTDGFENVHGGFVYGEHNEDGNRILEFAESHGFCLLNTYFRKRLEHLITYKSGPSATQFDFFAVKQQHRRLFKNAKVIPGKSYIPRYALALSLDNSREDLAWKIENSGCGTLNRDFPTRLPTTRQPSSPDISVASDSLIAGANCA
ncbi:hypothetical protein HELRODRAFT_178174 [Helobdella robusta]|uniref:Endonuclease/exonuclease/phosphatase domain-containing protein n=1 Tax=Helobdella robusta TaxID=6412 RepID=T1FCW1_HELRO|nr:hypothetical protein HELRODRAFT_178174 [Helobdella robusta]ESN97383.1 hypothetical protein HELRODRAFT_178174 [Helobdella robusta]